MTESAITQVTDAEAQRLEKGSLNGGVEKGGFFTRLLRCTVCCGRAQPDEGSELPDRLQSRTVFIPPAPHAGKPFIGPLADRDVGRKTLVLDLDETLVHSSFKPVPNPDYVIPVEIDGKITDVYVLKRPWVDHFLAEVGAHFEVIVFTASLAKYADPLLDLLDRGAHVRWRLFRESCYPYEGNYVKDLTCLSRDLRHTVIVDNSPHSYIFQPFNAVPVRTWIDDMADRDLLDLLPILQMMADADDVTTVVAQTYLPGVSAIYGAA